MCVPERSLHSAAFFFRQPKRNVKLTRFLKIYTVLFPVDIGWLTSGHVFDLSTSRYRLGVLGEASIVIGCNDPAILDTNVRFIHGLFKTLLWHKLSCRQHM